MIWASKGTLVALAANQLCSPVAAGIGEGAQPFLLISDDQYWHADEINREEVTGIWQALNSSKEIPRMHENAIDLSAEEIF